MLFDIGSGRHTAVDYGDEQNEENEEEEEEEEEMDHDDSRISREELVERYHVSIYRICLLLHLNH